MPTANPTPAGLASPPFCEEDYLRFSRLVAERFGLFFPEKRRNELEFGVRQAFLASTCPDFNSYFAVLNDSENGPLELERLVNHLTIGETHFFRDSGQFDALANYVLPGIIIRRRTTRTIRIWSAGCASGEEPYSIAMLLRDLVPDIDSWTIMIYGTDVNTRYLEWAKRGVYGQRSFREARAFTYRDRFFKQVNNQYHLHPSIRRMVTFGQLNLAEDRYPSYETNTMFMDLILCRNVTIYFPESVTRRVIQRFYQSLCPGGWLVVGHSEHSLGTYQRFHTHNFPNAILYQRPLEDTPAAQERPAPPEAARLPARSGAGLSPKAAADNSKMEVRVEQRKPDPISRRYRRGRTTGLLVLPSLAVKSAPASQPANAVEEAQSLLASGHADQARDLLKRWIDQHPDDGKACALLGKAHAGLGEWAQAERWCQRAVQSDPLNLEGYYILGLVYQHQHKTAQAITLMRKVLYIDHADILGHFTLANLYHQCGQDSLAIKSLENARRLLEKYPPDALVPRSDEISVKMLMHTVIRQQNTWKGKVTEYHDEQAG